MKKQWEQKIGDDTKIVTTVNKFPDGFKFSMVYLLLLDRWVDIARIDNYPHNGREETHIHRFREKRVEFREMSFDEAKEILMRIGGNIKEKIKNGRYRNR